MFKLRKHGLRYRLFKRNKINDGSGDNNNNSNEGEKTKEIDRNLFVSDDRIQKILVKLRQLRVRNSVLKRNKINDGSGDNNNNFNEGEKTKEIDRNLSLSHDLIPKILVKLRQLRVRNPVLKRKKNINNGSGDNNNNSNEGEKTKEMVLCLPPKRGQTLSKAVEVATIMEEAVDAIASLEMQVRAMEKLAKLLASRRVAALEADVAAGGGGDGSGGGGDGSGGDCDGDNDGGDKTEGGGGGGGGGKMGTKIEPKGQHDNRNRFSYHGGDENGYPVGQLHRCYYQKPNVCSIIYHIRC